ncbi:hypothetical protein ASG29_15615 [Sphingomonas sp. Leaf412]|uniref:oligosaccharide flippase family protein n=1 Tax=Sphingomonas sp. Leaf412 TaxID=1736370 RepID=UPI0006FAB8D1|nr:oligosaccharide flippase family protein [Sphingomonas sp. Leaf412]KQT31370.1 hypothetical protein ASG29_15615 [Sphingomonas sp. Leaf412]
MASPAARRGMMAFTVGNAVAQAAALLRYMLLARLLGPTQLGLAATLILTAQFFEQITDAGLDRYLVQSREGNRGAVGRAIHLAIILRGLLIGGAIALSAPLIAGFFGHAGLADGLRLLALAPVIGGFVHLDYRRVQRHHHFGPEGVLTAISEIASLIALIVAALVLRSYVAIAIALVTRAAAQVALSHRLARRPYRLGLPGAHGRAMAAFGLPLVLNGVLLFLGGQGDRLIIGSRLGPTDLGHYSAIILLIFYPATILSRQLQSLHLPTLAAARNDAQAQAREIASVGGQAVVIAILMAIGFALVAPLAVPLIYGSRFAAPALLIAIVGMLQAARFVRLWPTVVSLAAGRSGNLLVNSIVRLAAFPIALLLAPYWGLPGIVAGFIAGEFVAFAASMLLLHRGGLGRPAQDWSRIALLGVCFVAVAGLVAGTTQGRTDWLVAGIVAATAAAAWLAMRERAAIASLLDVVRRRMPGIARRIAPRRS